MAYAEGLALRTDDRINKGKRESGSGMSGTRNDTKALFPEAFPDG